MRKKILLAQRHTPIVFKGLACQAMVCSQASIQPATRSAVLALTLLVLGCTDSHRRMPLSSTGSQSGDVSVLDEQESGQQVVVYFYSKGCPECADVKESVIPLLLENGMLVEEICVDTNEGLRRVLEVEQHYDVEIETLAPLMLVDGKVLQGTRSIHEFFLR